MEADREFLERLDAHIAQGNEIMRRSDETMRRSDETMRRSNEVMGRNSESMDRSDEIMKRSNEIMERSNEVIERSRETFADARVAMREWMRRDEAVFQQLSAQNARTLAGLEEVRDDIRAQTQAILTVLDWLPAAVGGLKPFVVGDGSSFSAHATVSRLPPD